MRNSRVRWIVTVDEEIKYKTETDNRSEAQTWADHNLDHDNYHITSTTPETDNWTSYYF